MVFHHPSILPSPMFPRPFNTPAAFTNTLAPPNSAFTVATSFSRSAEFVMLAEMYTTLVVGLIISISAFVASSF